MSDLKPVILGSVFSLVGVVIGALLMPLTQLHLERERAIFAADRAKLLVAGELLHAQVILRVASEGEHWPYAPDMDATIARLPSSLWEENRSSLVGHVDDELFESLVIAYANLEIDRLRIFVASKLPADRPMTPEEAQSLKRNSDVLGRLRRQLGGGALDWPDEIKGSNASP